LAVFLILLSVLIIQVIRLLRRAEQVADNVDAAASAFRKGAAAVPIIKLVTTIITKAQKRKRS
jgi:hypothetical protein